MKSRKRKNRFLRNNAAVTYIDLQELSYRHDLSACMKALFKRGGCGKITICSVQNGYTSTEEDRAAWEEENEVEEDYHRNNNRSD